MMRRPVQYLIPLSVTRSISHKVTAKTKIVSHMQSTVQPTSLQRDSLTRETGIELQAPQSAGDSSAHEEPQRDETDVQEAVPSTRRLNQSGSDSSHPPTTAKPNPVTMTDVTTLQKKTKYLRSTSQTDPGLFGGSVDRLCPSGINNDDVDQASQTRGRTYSDNLRVVPSLFDERSMTSELTSLTAYTVVPDGGQSLQADFVRQSPNDALQDWPHPASSLVEVLQTKLYNERIQSASGADNFFIPHTKLEEIMRFEEISIIVQECGLSLTRQRWDGLQRPGYSSIPPDEKQEGFSLSYRTVFAILIMMDKHTSIGQFVKEGISDSKLPLLRNNGGSPDSLTSFPDPSVNASLRGILSGWKPQERDKFFGVQWELIPTFFAKKPGNMKVPHYELLSGHVLPYVYFPHPVQPDPGETEDMNGLHGHVTTYHLHPSLQNLDRHTVSTLLLMVTIF